MNIIKRTKLFTNQIKTTENDLDLLQRLQTSRGRRDYALEVLGMSSEDLRNIKSINREGVSRFSMRHLGIKSRSQLDRIKKWMKMSRADRISALAPDSDNNLRDFLNQSYAEHRRRKKHHKNNWKYKSFSTHIQSVLTRLDKCQDEDAMDLEDCTYIITQLYYAFWVKVNGKKDVRLSREETKAAIAA